jgi:tetrahydromethanopterin S-methyltransferase subunit G
MTHEAAQKLHDDLSELVKALRDANQRIDHIVSEFCERIVERSGMLAHAAFAASGDARERIEKAIIEFSAYDEYLRKQMRGVDIEIFTAKESAEAHRQAFREMWNLRAAEFGTVKERLDRVESRHREHAINSPEVREKVWAITDGRCIYCDVEMTRERDPAEPNRCFEVDHIVAKSNGGPDHLSNYVPACHQCNTSKSAKSIFRFLANKQALPGLRIVGGSDA